VLANVRIVLVQTSHPGNIGATARAMKTMGIDTLWLVNPERFPHSEATALASGADDILAAARVCKSLDEALADCRLVVGASARLRSIPSPRLDPRGCARVVRGESERAPVALVFGREQSGLTNTELDRCHYLVQIPSAPDFASLNLAAAVQLLSYEIMTAHIDTQPQPPTTEIHQPVGGAEMERFFRHLEQTMIDVDFLDPQNPRHLMRRMRRLFNRARPDAKEINILRGILTAARKKIAHSGH
jgi:tRNA (cytidine32/uridine32-2'-O)-methyltransferase